LAAGLLVEGAGATGALLAMGGVYFLATLSPLVFPSWRTLDDVPGTEPVQKPVPQAEVKAEAPTQTEAPTQAPAETPAPAPVSSSAPSRPTPGP
ncbi:MFS transporter, partial [Streptomyces parvus]